ncbi:hypothetical protein AB0362_06900 [Rhodococcus sp. NPDC079359]|uniref:serine O-acetyltransferase n=1 Tax=Rhodococcus sp. NPDC079359 TaxID=3154961 RepID=UPI00344FE925
MSLKRQVSADLSRIYQTTSAVSALKALALSTAFNAAFLYRLSHAVFPKNRPIALLIARLNIALNGIDIDPRASIDDGILFQHPTGVVIGGGVEIGAYCTLMGGITIGRKKIGFDSHEGYPTIGAGVVVGANASILGEIKVGNESTIGASSVLLASTEDGSVWAGNPARIIRATQRIN